MEISNQTHPTRKLLSVTMLILLACQAHSGDSFAPSQDLESRIAVHPYGHIYQTAAINNEPAKSTRLNVSKLSLYSRSGEFIAKVRSVASDGTEKMLVLSFPGQLKEVTLPMSRCMFDGNKLWIDADPASVRKLPDVDINYYTEVTSGRYSLADFSNQEPKFTDVVTR